MAFGSSFSFLFATLFLIGLAPLPLRSQVCDPAAALHRWQKRLNLDQWKITVSFAVEAEIGAEILGDIEYHQNTRTAAIRILRSGSVRECENTVLHELLHLMLSKVTPPVDSDEEERIVSDLAEALLATAELAAQGNDPGAPSARAKVRSQTAQISLSHSHSSTYLQKHPSRAASSPNPAL